MEILAIDDRRDVQSLSRQLLAQHTLHRIIPRAEGNMVDGAHGNNPVPEAGRTANVHDPAWARRVAACGDVPEQVVLLPSGLEPQLVGKELRRLLVSLFPERHGVETAHGLVM